MDFVTNRAVLPHALVFKAFSEIDFCQLKEIIVYQVMQSKLEFIHQLMLSNPKIHSSQLKYAHLTCMVDQ